MTIPQIRYSVKKTHNGVFFFDGLYSDGSQSDIADTMVIYINSDNVINIPTSFPTNDRSMAPSTLNGETETTYVVVASEAAGVHTNDIIRFLDINYSTEENDYTMMLITHLLDTDFCGMK